MIANLLVYVWHHLLMNAESTRAVVLAFGVIPAALVGQGPLSTQLPPLLTIFTSMFLHGGFLHLAGNMLYLWIFGNNVEDAMGHVRFLVFYLLCGVAAVYAQALPNPESIVPMIGASGAISGVLGAYFLLFPHASVLTLVIFGFFWRVVRIPAIVVLGFWMIVQILNGLGSFGAGGGVAWFAHIGGFFAGMGLILLFRPRPRTPSWR